MDELRDLYASSGPFASVLVDVSMDSESGEHELELRAREVASRLAEQGAPEEIAERVRAVVAQPVHEPAPRSRLVVAAGDSVLLDRLLQQRTAVPVVTWAPLPDVGRLLTHRAEGTSFVLVSVDHTGGTVTTYDSHEIDETDSQSVEGDDAYVHKVGGGGWAHRRFQETSENVWRDNARQVAEVVVSKVRQGERLVVVAGSPESRGEIVAALEGTRADVVTLDRAGANADGGEESLTVELRTAVEQHLEEQRRDLAATLEERLGQGRGAVVGLDKVLDAFVKGQVETLVVDLDAVAEETVKVNDHPGLAVPGVADDQPVRADLVLVAAALGTDAEVRPAPHGRDESVAALLRWDDQDGPQPDQEV